MNLQQAAEHLMNTRSEVVLYPKGNSMRPKITSGQRVLVRYMCPIDVRVGDIVLAKVKGFYYLHLVKAIDDNRFLIGNNHGKINGWTHQDNVFGRVEKIG